MLSNSIKADNISDVFVSADSSVAFENAVEILNLTVEISQVALFSMSTQITLAEGSTIEVLTLTGNIQESIDITTMEIRQALCYRLLKTRIHL